MEQPKFDVFISYSRDDIERVKTLKTEIEEHTNARCWLDLYGIESGTPNFTKTIIKAINACPVFLFMLTSNSLKSDMAIKELNFAYRKHEDNGKKVVVVCLEECELSDEFIFNYNKTDIIEWDNIYQKEKLISNISSWINEQDRVGRYKEMVMSDVFLCHSMFDNHIVEKVKELLKKNAISFFDDKDALNISQGIDYGPVLKDAIRFTKLVLIFYSENSRKSENVKKEILFMVACHKKFVVLNLDAVPYQDHFSILSCMPSINASVFNDTVEKKLIKYLGISRNSCNHLS